MSSNQTTSVAAVLVRIFWMFAGPATLVILAYSIWDNSQSWLDSTSIAYLVVLAAVVAVRWLDPQSSEAGDVTPRELRMFSATAIGIGLTVWIGAHLLSAPV
jgi:hypothetical protein